jgi:hypothetical protein
MLNVAKPLSRSRVLGITDTDEYAVIVPAWSESLIKHASKTPIHRISNTSVD